MSGSGSRGSRYFQGHFPGPRTTKWLLWKVLVPLFFIAALWPLYAFVLGIPHPFPRAFAQGELMLFSAIILIEAAVEGESFNGDQLRLCQQLSMVLAFLFIFVFGFIRSDVVSKEIVLGSMKPADAELVLGKLRGYACFNCSVTVFALAFGVYSFWTNADNANQKRMEQLGQEPEH